MGPRFLRVVGNYVGCPGRAPRRRNGGGRGVERKRVIDALVRASIPSPKGHGWGSELSTSECDCLWAEAGRHGVLGGVVRYVSPIPGSSRMLLATWAAAARLDAALLARIAEYCARKRMRVLLLKGQSLSRLYPENYVRPSSDIDIVVDPPDWESAVDGLLALGGMLARPVMTEDYHAVVLMRCGAIQRSVEVHRGFMEEYENPWTLSDIANEACVRRADGILGLTAEWGFLYQCLHLVKDSTGFWPHVYCGNAARLLPIMIFDCQVNVSSAAGGGRAGVLRWADSGIGHWMWLGTAGRLCT